MREKTRREQSCFPSFIKYINCFWLKFEDELEVDSVFTQNLYKGLKHEQRQV